MAYTTIDDGSAHFQTATYTGTGSNQSITNGGNSNLQPDWVWVKDRGATNDHKITDSNRLASSKPSITLESNTNNAEYDDADPMSTDSFDTDGFTIGTNGNYNTNTNTYVAWQWKANGGTTTTNDASSTGVGSIDSVYQANTTAGFSIVTWTGTGSAATIAHGLGATPQVIILKSRDNAHDWLTGHNSMHSTPWEKYLTLHTTNAVADDVIWNDTAPTSTVFSVGSYDSTNGNNVKLVAYCFAPIQGYSKFGSYTGNGTSSSADFNGPFVYTGFKPAWIMTKRSSASNGSWAIVDNKRDTTNPTQIALFANTNGADDTDKKVDFLSNGFKLRNSRDDFNTDGVTYVYMAFAEHPFVSSKGVPVTAK